MQVSTSAFTRQKEDLRQAAAIGQATASDTKVIIMDEPTSCLERGYDHSNSRLEQRTHKPRLLHHSD